MTDQDRKLANFNLHNQRRLDLLMPALVIVWTLFCVFGVILAGLIWGMKFAGWV